MKRILFILLLSSIQTYNGLEVPSKKNILKTTGLGFFYGALYCGYKICTPLEEESYCNSPSIIYAAVGATSLCLSIICGTKSDQIQNQELLDFTQSIVPPPAPGMVHRPERRINLLRPLQ